MTTTTTTIAQLEETGPSSYSRHGSDISTHVLHRLPTTNVNDTEEPPADAFEAIPDGGIDSWITVSACGFLTFWSNGYISSWGVLQAAILQSSYMEVNIWTLSFVGSLALACIVAFGTLSVRAMKLFGMRYTCLVAVLLLGLGPILTSFTLNHLGGLFCTAGALVGVTSSILYTASNSLPVQWFSSKLGTANGLVKAGGGIGATVLPIAAQGLINAIGLPWTFRALGFLILATGVPSALLLKERRRTISTARIDWLMLKKVPFLYLCLAGAASTFALYVPPFFIPLFARSMGLSPSTGAGLVAGFGLSTTFGRMLSGVVCDKLGPLNTLALTMLVNTVSMLAIWPVSSSLAPLVLFAIINGAGNGSFFVAMPTAIAALSGPGLASGAMSIGTSFWTLGDLLGTPIAGILIASTGAATSSTIEPYRAAIFYAGGVSLVGLVLVVTSRFSVNTKVLKRL
ncbi:hypothetical protein LTR70_005231 [Exophiala xenobiotica]|nr:hypothetical protein LTR70_005231 [Exophiala xenobiotica]